MRYPYLREIPTERATVDVFGGYNHNLKIAENEFYDMQNMTSCHYPILSPRRKRGIYATPSSARCLCSKDALCYLDGSYFVMNEYRVDLGLSAYAEASMVSMGAYIIILTKDEHGNPVDNVYINTKDITDHGQIEAEYRSPEGAEIKFELCAASGETYNAVLLSDQEPTECKNGDLWIDVSSDPTLKKYSSSSGMWVSVASTYIRITSPGIGKNFSESDGVNISGVTIGTLADLNRAHVIHHVEDDAIVITGMLNATVTTTDPITVTRKMPYMDFVIESENRLWGCRYGFARNGSMVNEIYASKLGDFRNWECYAGISTDSYAVSVGTDGPFTGAITHLGYPLFFKENCLHKIYGNYPANYQIQTTTLRGVQKGSHRSLAIVNEILFYKSRGAICAYDGSLPQEISSALGDASYSDAVAAGHINKYYVSMKDESGAWHLFVYDVKKGMWHREDNTRASFLCSHEGELYFIDHADGKIRTAGSMGTTETAPVRWMVESGILGTDSPDKKYVSRLNLRMRLPVGSTAILYAEYDSSGSFEHLGTLNGYNLQTFTLPVPMRRCDHFRLKIEGVGDAKIYSITKTIEGGSDI